jgi:hypothetical protein
MKSKSTERSERAARATAAMHVGSAASSAGMHTSEPAPGAAQPKTPAADHEPANRLPDPDAGEKTHRRPAQ